MKKIAVLLVAIIGGVTSALAGQDTLNVTVNSDPPSAMVYANRKKQQFGYAPVTLTYKASKGFAAGKKCMKLQAIVAKWADGIESSSKSFVLCPKDGTSQQVTLVRPAGGAKLRAPQPFVVQNNLPSLQPRGPRGPKTFYVTYHSDPEGAMLYQNGSRPLGYTPVRLKYESPKEFRDGTACATLQPTQVRWVSGAIAEIDSLQACSVNGGEQSFVFARPTGVKSDAFPNGAPVPGLEIDLQFAFQRELLARLDAQAAAQATSDAWARLAASVSPPPIIRRPLSCTSLVIGQQVFTNCQ